MENENHSSLPEICVAGRFLKEARLRDEFWQEKVQLDSAGIECLAKTVRGRADLVSVIRALPETAPLPGVHVEWENAAVANTQNFEAWWESLPQESRKNVRRSQKRGVEVREAAFNDELITGISAIYNETPLRQGRRFWHYGKPLEKVKEENATYSDRSTFVGAYIGSELIGFVKFVRVGQVGRIMQILSKDAHADKRPTNALLAKSVEICSKMSLVYFVYGQYVYGTKENSPMTEFKRRNGFERLDYARNYVPISLKGKLALSTGFHKEIRNRVPEFIVDFYLKTRAGLLQRRLVRNTGDLPAAACAAD